MPTNVVWLERLMYTSLLVGAAFRLFAPRDRAAIAADLDLTPGAVVALTAVVVAVIFAIGALLTWLVARRRTGWIRYLFALFLAWDVYAFVRVYEAGRAYSLNGAFHAVQLLLELVALFLIFTGNARQWFARPVPQH